MIRKTWLLAAAVLAAGAAGVHAQWLTQKLQLKAGWNSVYLHVDASHETLNVLLTGDPQNPIQEVWLWNPAPSTLQFVQSPQAPVGGGSQWTTWVRSGTTPSNLQRLIGNAAYLVKVDSASSGYEWSIKGMPVAPRGEWTSSGLNFIGFSTSEEAGPTFQSFLAPHAELQAKAEIFRYVGGPLGPQNPEKVNSPGAVNARRGEAFWVRAGEMFNRYFGPVSVQPPVGDGVHFGESSSQVRLRLRNMAGSAATFTLRLIPSEEAPATETPIQGAPAILVRGALNTTNLTYAFDVLNDGPKTWVLQGRDRVGSEVDVVLGLDRSKLTGLPGSLHAAVLRFSDSLGLSQVDIPVSAVASSNAGLWLGEASVTQVRHYLRSYEKDASGALVQTPEGKYVAASTNSTLGDVSRPHPLRLIVHNNARGESVLLQRFFYGPGPGSTNVVIATQESLLDPANLKAARRISAAHLPFAAENVPWAMTGALAQGTNLAALVSTGYDDHRSSPFVHTYHPDHDNLNATFSQKEPQGAESFGIVREIRLTFAPPGDDFQSLTGSGETLSGQYDETIRIEARAGEYRSFEVRGDFTLNRISTIPQLTEPSAP